MNAKFLRTILVAVFFTLLLAGCNNPRAESPSGFWPWTWGDKTLAQSLENGCQGGALSTTIDGSTYQCTSIPTPCTTNCGDQPAPVANPPYTWTESTCVTLGTEMGLTLTSLKEGDFYACVYSGSIVPINIPAGILADVDRGGIKVATGPVYTESSHVTFRPWDGSLEEACAQVKNLSDFGQLQNPKFTASPLNFSCR